MEANQNHASGNTFLRLSRIQLASLTLLLVYFVVRFLLIQQVDQLGTYASYICESIFVAIVWVLFRKRIVLNVRPTSRLGIDAALMLVSGWCVYKMASPLSLVIPFNFGSTETLLFLLLIGPVLEEMIFRMSHWELLSEFISNPFVLLLLTSCIFSFAHFFAWWSVPVGLHSFVLYQAAYTFGLALYCGFRRMQTNSMAAPILVHFFFNAGFYIGFLA